MRHLLPGLYKSSRKKEDFMGFLGISAIAFVEAQNAKRKHLRTKARQWRRRRHSSKIRRQKKRQKKGDETKDLSKWLNRGKLSIGRNARITSFETDGVGASFTFTVTPEKLPFVAKNSKARTALTWAKQNAAEEQKYAALRGKDERDGRQQSFIGVDLGRAKIFYAATEVPGDWKEPRSFVFTRRQYKKQHRYYEMHMEEERIRRLTPNLRRAFEALAEARKTRSDVAYLETQRHYYEVLYLDAIRSKKRSFMRMKTFRLKTSSLDKNSNQILLSGFAPPTQNQAKAGSGANTATKTPFRCDSLSRLKPRVVVGIGAANFPSNSKGEISVPTKRARRAFAKAQKRMECLVATNKLGPVTFLSIDEFRSSQRCWDCHRQLYPVMVNARVKRKTGKPIFRVQAAQI